MNVSERASVRADASGLVNSTSTAPSTSTVDTATRLIPQIGMPAISPHCDLSARPGTTGQFRHASVSACQEAGLGES